MKSHNLLLGKMVKMKVTIICFICNLSFLERKVNWIADGRNIQSYLKNKKRHGLFFFRFYSNLTLLVTHFRCQNIVRKKKIFKQSFSENSNGWVAETGTLKNGELHFLIALIFGGYPESEVRSNIRKYFGRAIRTCILFIYIRRKKSHSSQHDTRTLKYQCAGLEPTVSSSN